MVFGVRILPSKKFLNDVSSLLRTSCRTLECTVANYGFSFQAAHLPVRHTSGPFPFSHSALAFRSKLFYRALCRAGFWGFLLLLIWIEPELIRRKHIHYWCKEYLNIRASPCISSLKVRVLLLPPNPKLLIKICWFLFFGCKLLQIGFIDLFNFIC